MVEMSIDDFFALSLEDQRHVLWERNRKANAELARAREEISRLRAEVARLTADAADAVARQARLLSMTVEDGISELSLETPRELTLVWVDVARRMLGDAPNYSETRVDFPSVSMEVGAAGSPDRYVLTVQRAGKLTPHEARRAAEAKLERLRAACDEAEESATIGFGGHRLPALLSVQRVRVLLEES